MNLSLNWLKRLLHRPTEGSAPAPERLSLSLTESGFSALMSGPHTPVYVRWSDVSKITLFITDKGPFQDSHFLHIAHAGGDLTLPHKAKNMAAFIDALRKLEGFDVAAYESGLATQNSGHFVTCYTA
ncbi:MAG: hypothetical protein QM645_04310 [Asticcacaulis sp.]